MTKGSFSISRNKLDEIRLDPYTLKGFTDPEEFRRRISTLNVGEEVIEKLLSDIAWYPYRRLDFIDRTSEFVRICNKIYLSRVNSNSQISEWGKQERLQKGSYLHPNELLVPWIDYKHKTDLRTNPRWKHWVKARRCADKRSMIYDDYIAGALNAARKRGWKHWPTPQALHSKKLLGFIDNHPDSIQAYVEGRYSRIMKLTEDPYFMAKLYDGSSVQNDYLLHVAREIERINPGIAGLPNLVAKRIWKDFQTEGRVPASLSHDDVLNSRFT